MELSSMFASVCSVAEGVYYVLRLIVLVLLTKALLKYLNS